MPNSANELSTITEQPTFTQEAEAPVAQPRNAFEPLLYLRNHPKIAIATFLIVLLAGSAVLASHRSFYTAQSIVYVSPKSPTELADNHEADREYDSFFEQQIYAVTRPDNLQGALESYREFWMNPGEDEQAAFTRLQKALRVEQMGHSYQLSISLDSAKRQGLAEFVNEITSRYINSSHKDEGYGRDAQIAALTKDRKDLNDELDKDLKKQEGLLGSLGMAQLNKGDSTNPYDAQMQNLRDQLAAAHEKRDEADAQVYALNPDDKASGSRDAAALSTTIDPGVAAMETQLSTRRAALMLQMNGLTPQNPLYIQSKAELDQVNTQLNDISKEASEKTTTQLAHRYSAEHERAVRLETQLHSDLEKTQALAAGVTPRLQQAQQVGAEIERIQSNFAMIDNRINSLSLEGNAPGSEHVVTWAVTPGNAVSKHTILYILALLFACVIAATGAAFLAETADPYVYSAPQIRNLLGFSPIGMLLQENEFPAAISSEYMLRLAAGIDQAHRRSGARTFLFTSAGTGDTRELVQRLGAEMASSGLSTLVILLGNPQSPRSPMMNGAEQINGAADSSQALLRKDTQNGPVIDMQAAGEACQVITRSPQGMAEFLRRVRSSYNTILIGGADPLLISAHSEHLARVADGTVIVAESGQVTKRQLTRVAKLLERLKVSGVAVVLSQITHERADREVLENVEEYSQRLMPRPRKLNG